MHKTLFLHLKGKKREKMEEDGLAVSKLTAKRGWHMGSVGLGIWGLLGKYNRGL